MKNYKIENNTLSGKLLSYKFLDNGMKTTDLEADKGIVANLLIAEVSGQVWLTGLGR